MYTAAINAAEKVPAQPEQLSHGRERLRDLRVRLQACPSINEQVKSQGRASTPNLGADLSKHIFSCLGNKSSAREPPFGVQACNRKDKPEDHGAASRPKEG